METKPNQQAQKPQKSGCCGCGCSDARELEAGQEQTAARPESAQPEPAEKSCCGG